jgi:hypothetical protein
VQRIYFFECAGEKARKRLERLRQDLIHSSAIPSPKLLKNTKQAELFLLVVETSEELHVHTLEGIKVWTFEEVE